MRLTSKYQTIRRMLSDFKQPEYRYAQIMDAIFKQNVGKYERMTMIPKFLRDELTRTLGPHVCSIVPIKEFTSNQVSKVLFVIAGTERVEAVRYDNHSNYNKWLDLNPIKMKECTSCQFLPLCMGGCAKYNFQQGTFTKENPVSIGIRIWI